MTASIRYRIAPLDPHAHLFEVQCTIDSPEPSGQSYRLPTWVPGSYLVREFARHFVRVSASDSRGPVAIGKVAKDLWRAAPAHGPLTVTAEIYAYDLSVRTAYLDAHRAFFNGSAVFLCPEGHAQSLCEVEIVAPEGEAYRGWRVATAMPSHGADPHGFGRYGAESYEELIDHPVEMSAFTLATFEAGGARHEIAISGRHDADLDRLCTDLQRVCAWQCRLFEASGRAPFDRYVFLVAAVGDGYGGLEHRASTSLICKRDELPQRGVREVTNDYRSFLGLASHEYFHSWNVKRIKPAAFVPYDLAREGYTRLLWAFEGITSYYDDLALVRSGVLSLEDFLELVGRTITSVLRTPGRHVQSVADSSFDAWIKFYRPDENTPNAVISYYAKGALVALALDLILRRNGSSLDVLMRLLWQRHGTTGTGVPEDGLPALVQEVAGRSLDDFFARYVDGTDDPPLEELFSEVGITLHVREQENAGDRGGKPPAPQRPDGRAVWLGVKLASGAELRVQHVLRGSPAEHAGLAAGDVIVAIDGLRASADAIDKLGRRRSPGDTVEVVAFRRDELMQVQLGLEAAPRDTCWLALDEHAPADAIARRDAWLSGATHAPLG
ncbi:MAG: PDZ domain-containing protein [Pseudomonadota bacterium]|nr:PDZ domain-containing protein [Pseudomonadota bacterium]